MFTNPALSDKSPPPLGRQWSPGSIEFDLVVFLIRGGDGVLCHFCRVRWAVGFVISVVGFFFIVVISVVVAGLVIITWAVAGVIHKQPPLIGDPPWVRVWVTRLRETLAEGEVQRHHLGLVEGVNCLPS
jgi:hypothetical protein